MENVMLKGRSTSFLRFTFILLFVQYSALLTPYYRCISRSIPQARKQKEAKGLSLHKERDMACAFKSNFTRYKPHLCMLLSQIGYAIVYFFTEATFSQGLSPHIYVAYRFCLAGLLMLPFAYFLERNSRPKLTLALFLEFTLLSFIGISLTLNMHFASLKYTSPAFVASILNTVPSWTFVIAIILRMEVVDIKNPRGIAEVLGTLISLAGVTTITLYKGPSLQSPWGAIIHIKRLFIHENWVKGSILTVASCISWAIWYIIQATTLKKYPAQVSLALWMNCIGAAQTAVFSAFLLQHKPSEWSIKMFSANFWCIIFSGMCSGVFVFLQLWCMKEKGPVFVAGVNSLQTVLVVILAYFVLGEKLHTGRPISILGGVLVIIGLYVLLWGKDRDQSYITTQDQQSSSHPDELSLRAAKEEEVASAEKKRNHEGKPR